MWRVLAICLLSLTVPALASNPGEPLDCSDWVFAEPGLACTVIISNCDDSSSPWCQPGYSTPPDNDGGLLALRLNRAGTSMPCGGVNFDIAQIELLRLTSSGESVLAFLPWRCGPGNTADVGFPIGKENGSFVSFDDKTGSAYFAVRAYCSGNAGQCAYPQLPGTVSVLRIQGFTTDFELLSSYQPANKLWSFRVPYRPEGFPAADYFDTYYGDLATVGDWSQAQPLQCAFPMAAPTVGDYITVNDPLPDPAPGLARYYITSVNYQGQIRYGRKHVNGVLSGRDPGVLPPCN